jgi:phosphatidylinositol-3,4,5-trisphosphate-dependent Rac exchanger protein 1
LHNAGLSSSCPEYDLTVLQRSINEKSLQVLKEYYRQMRMYRLNKDHLPHDPVEQQAAIHQISQPLNSLDILMNQVEHMLDHIYTDGVGILSLTSEAAVRMGGVRITSCDSGVYRSLMSLTLEEAALLVRCHGLPMKGFRTVLNTLREGTLSLLEKKNNVNIKVSFPTVPPRLYRVRLTGDKTDDETG